MEVYILIPIRISYCVKVVAQPFESSIYKKTSKVSMFKISQILIQENYDTTFPIGEPR